MLILTNNTNHRTLAQHQYKFCLKIIPFKFFWYVILLLLLLLTSIININLIKVKGGGWNSETGCIPFQYICRTYAVAGENYDLLYEVF